MPEFQPSAVLHPGKLAEMLTSSGRMEVTETDVRGDVQAGAPIAADGSGVPLLAYVAWLFRRREHGH